MHHLIATYLFKNKYCPLPGLGTLQINNTSAQSDFINNIFKSPAQSIHFITKEEDASDLLDSIAEKTNTVVPLAIENLSNYTKILKEKINSNQSSEILGIGNFTKNEKGAIIFNPELINEYFFPNAIAKKVIHPDAAHTILVGDKETTNTVMTEYFHEVEQEIKDRWWIWALVIGGIALAIILYYYSDMLSTTFGGNNSNILQ